MPEVWSFLKTVWKFWKVNLTGSVFIALLLLFQIFVQSIAWWIYAGIAAATLLMSCFLAWRDECRSRLALESSRGEEWFNLLGQANAERSSRLETERELEVTKRQLEEAKQQLADERENKLTVDEIVLREARKEFRNLTPLRNLTLPPRHVLNGAWIIQTATRNSKTVAEIDAAIDRVDGQFHWQKTGN